ncbi:hypothetical protein [Paenibacillus ottowii]|uniref:Uncharacterized protein n=1 Tax=Paenibacillus ottowii TaxID=2315729 RepID=A0ABY3BBE3_9BACL|nr:hypothetical protein [Paenibacillus ottowii]TQS01409.1 hypothetical protein FKV70_03490 [Paenibacillus ottowii]TQS01464.1 hypothetical protein FKV70_03780 [Paenibacillus ottowii]
MLSPGDYGDSHAHKKVEIESKVTTYIQGKNGLIGIIIPPCEGPTNALEDLHRTIAEIAIKQAIKKEATPE